ncbi:MAG TPA: hypothetical protein PKN28_06510 [Clostridiales bacterium]|nr:hypothetical protein [Clostridiales bacterium]
MKKYFTVLYVICYSFILFAFDITGHYYGVVNPIVSDEFMFVSSVSDYRFEGNRYYLGMDVPKGSKAESEIPKKNLVEYEEKLYAIEQGKKLKSYTGDEITAETVTKWIEDTLERYEAEQDKLNFFEDCMDKIGGVQFSKENIKVGYIVELKKNYGKCEVVGAGPANITYKILEGGARGMVLTCAYAAIEKIIAVKEKPEIENPYKEGDILTLNRPADNSVYRAYQVVKATAKGVSMQEIEIENGIPQAGQFKAGSKPMCKGITINKFNNQPCIYCDGWQLYKYVEKSA